MRILLAHHGGSYEALPPAVAARLVELDSITQTELMRKKMKFLGHLPLTGEPVVSVATDDDVASVSEEGWFTPLAGLL